MIQFVGRRVVVEHPPRELFFVRTLNLDVNEQPALPAVFEPDLEEHVRDLLSKASAADDLLKLLVECFVTACPVHIGIDLREEEGEEPLEILRDVATLPPGRSRFWQIGGPRASGR